MQFVNTIYSRTGIFATATAAVWIAVTAFGEFFDGALNSACYSYLGCDSGFFGYDAIEHFLFGFAAVLAIVWVCRKFPQYSILSTSYWETGLVLVASITLIAVLWEIGECFRDAYLLDIAHETLLDFARHINYLAQPSNIDTMGDLAFNLFGSLLAVFYINPRLQKFCACTTWL
ncbi:hypothetical protein CO131_00390 [Candidatus Kaiserbacteria bacterium CG_4_9_14_3_um_filter_50_16]|nr:MAG: hypothetical protein CO131_00390 [Candidatus Kaiserbacteria bacterium CG_4_9_14_3_um_filter_50_16]